VLLDVTILSFTTISSSIGLRSHESSWLQMSWETSKVR